MASEHDRRCEELFKAALALAPEARLAFVAAQCGGDASLRCEVEGLLRFDDAASSFLESPIGDFVKAKNSARSDETHVDRVIGRYRLRRLIAAGGMGAVFEATQERPDRTVALKLMRSGIASRSALRRFEYESQVLARLRHPCIAQLFDAGVHDDGAGGVPYFVMEYIPDAQPLNDFARSRKLSVRERLELFSQVCSAIHHGHQKGIIHRDLKPANILVDGAGLIKIIDFGVARATDSDLAVTTMQTGVGELVGTLQYMSPEQLGAQSDDLDTRSDVYSLGVVLYELLCEQLPYDVGASHVGEASRIVREQAPQRPSTINRALRGDLETIVLKALEKDRERRYQSAAELADDIRRFLDGQPISARPPSVAYQLRTFARRNKTLVGGVATTFAVLVTGLAVVSVLALRIQGESARRAEVNTFFESLLLAADPFPAFGDTADAPRFGANARWIDVIDEAKRQLDERPLVDRETEAAIRNRIGLAYFWTTRYDEALAELSNALAMRRELLGEDDLRTLDTKMGLAYAEIFVGKNYEAERLALEVVDALERAPGASVAQRIRALHALLLAQFYLNYDHDTYATGNRINELAAKHPEMDLRGMASRAVMAATLRRHRERAYEAERLAQQAIDETGDSPNHTLARGYGEMVIGWIEQGRGNLAVAEERIRRGIDLWTQRTGEPNPEFVLSLAAVICAVPGRREEGLSLMHDTMSKARERYGELHPFMFRLTWSSADMLRATGLVDEAAEAYRACIRGCDVGHHPPLQAHAVVMWIYADLLRGQERLVESETAYREAIARAERFTDAQWQRHSWKSVALLWAGLGEVLDRQERGDEAAAAFRTACAKARASMDALSAQYVLFRMITGGHGADGQDLAEALVAAERADEHATPADVADALFKLGRTRGAAGRSDDEFACYQQCIDLLREQRPNASANEIQGRVAVLKATATLLDSTGHQAEAELARALLGPQ